MTVEELLAEVVTLLQHEGRLSYRLLKRRFALDDDYLEDLKAELIDAKRLAVDEDGKVLVWVGQGSLASSVQRLESEVKEQASSSQTLDSRLSDSRLTVGERRQLTVLFCDMVGFTELASRVDPEVLDGIIRSYEDACAVCITRYGDRLKSWQSAVGEVRSEQREAEEQSRCSKRSTTARRRTWIG